MLAQFSAFGKMLDDLCCCQGPARSITFLRPTLPTLHPTAYPSPHAVPPHAESPWKFRNCGFRFISISSPDIPSPKKSSYHSRQEYGPTREAGQHQPPMEQRDDRQHEDNFREPEHDEIELAEHFGHPSGVACHTSSYDERIPHIEPILLGREHSPEITTFQLEEKTMKMGPICVSL